ncbi:CaiB/BaiF CoA transferase family protein [Salinisphaera aquimarina]|uniref:CaiB/BaiF CoA transferase family protein n=1 Tax=Salinisphaera aquimarina TaxID=2094031 RepID=A0ABV7EKM6_9GAMM
MQGPYADITVVEFGQFVVAPFCAQMLADAGARVIKVEPPTGDSYRSWADQLAPGETRPFLIKNRGKESIAINLGHPEAAPVVRALIEIADVVLVNLSPAAIKRRGLDYDAVAAINPKVIYGAVTAYGQVGPEAPLPGMDVVVQARSGLMSSLAAEQEGLAFHSEVQVADYTAAMLLFGGIGAALYARERSGVGQCVQTSLLGGALAIQNNALAHVYGHDEWRHEFVDAQLPALRKQRATHDEVEQVRRDLRPDPPTHTAHYGVFATADGSIALGAGSAPARRRLAAATGIAAAIADADPMEFGAQLKTLLVERSSADWVALMRENEVPVAEVRHVDELFFDPHVEAEGILTDYEHETAGRYRALATPIRMSATPFNLARAASPCFAAHTRPILSELGFDAAALEQLCEAGAVVAADRPKPEG